MKQNSVAVVKVKKMHSANKVQMTSLAHRTLS